MVRPRKDWPKRNVLTFRLSDPELHVLRFYAQHIAKDGEAFSDTLARVLRDEIIRAAEKELALVRAISSPRLSITKDSSAERRRQSAADLRRAAAVVRKSVEDGQEQPERYPTLIDLAWKQGVSLSDGLASPPVVASLASGAAHTPNTDDGEPTAKTQNLASPSWSAGQRPAESAGKIEDFSEDLVNSGFLPEGGLDETL